MAIDNVKMMAALKKAKLKTDLKAKITVKPTVTPLPKIMYRFQKAQ